MAKFNVQKGDKVIARTPSIYDPQQGKSIGGHEQHEKPLTVTKAHPSGVSTKERGFVHNNNIISKA